MESSAHHWVSSNLMDCALNLGMNIVHVLIGMCGFFGKYVFCRIAPKEVYLNRLQSPSLLFGSL